MSVADVAEKNHADAMTTYLAAVRAEGAGKKIKGGEQPVIEAMRVLNKSPEDYRRDRDIVKQYLQELANCDQHESAQQALKTAGKDLDEHDAETRRLIQAETNRVIQSRADARSAIAGNVAESKKTIQATKMAAERRAKLEADNWRLLDVEDVAVVEKRRHLMFLMRTGPNVESKTKIPILNAMTVLGDPQRHDLDQWEIVAGPGQSVDELAEIVAAWRAVKFGPPIRFLRGVDAANERDAACPDIRLVWDFNEVLNQNKDGASPAMFDAAMFTIFPWPGLDRAKCVDAVQKIARAYDRNPWTKQRRAEAEMDRDPTIAFYEDKSSGNISRKGGGVAALMDVRNK